VLLASSYRVVCYAAADAVVFDSVVAVVAG